MPMAHNYNLSPNSFFMYFIQHYFICRPSDSTVSEDAGIEPRTVAASALAVRHSNQSARFCPFLPRLKQFRVVPTYIYTERISLIATRTLNYGIFCASALIRI
jgi:hypothetical protein